jgi:hypothetical protein
MMKKNLVILLALAAVALASCGFPVRYTTVRGTGNVITETRRVTGFDQVELSGIGTLIIVQGDSESLEISAEENLMPYLESRVSGSTLNLGVEQMVNLQPTEEIIYRLTVIDLRAVETSGLGNMEIAVLETSQFGIEISGSSTIRIGDLQTEKLIVEVSGMGDITIAGRAAEQRIDLSGAGTYMADELETNSTRISISGSGNATVWAKEDLKAEISGMGTVKYFGSPIIDSEISGAGKLVSAGER